MDQPPLQSSSGNTNEQNSVGLPAIIELTNRNTGELVSADVFALTESIAGTDIDLVWWNEFSNQGHVSTAEDRHWRWAEFAKWSEGRFNTECRGVRDCQEKLIQGAILYEIGACSLLKDTCKVIHISRLATAPWNRRKPANNALYGGVGTNLLLYAVLHSYLLGLEGRIILSSLPSAQIFYEKLGFVRTNGKDDGMIVYELPEAVAIYNLRRAGWVQ